MLGCYALFIQLVTPLTQAGLIDMAQEQLLLVGCV